MSVVSPYMRESEGVWNSLVLVVSLDGKEDVFAWGGTNIDVDGSIRNAWDVKKAGGNDGATTTDKGYEATKVDVSMLLWTGEHFDEYARFVEVAKPRPGRSPKPIVTVEHPAIRLYGLSQFRIESIAFIDFEEVEQWTAKISFIEHVPAPKPAKKAGQSKPTDPNSIDPRVWNKWFDPFGINALNRALRNNPVKDVPAEKPSKTAPEPPPRSPITRPPSPLFPNGR